MDKQISKINEFINSLSNDVLNDHQSVMLSAESEYVGGDNTETCTNVELSACNGTNYICTNKGTCTGSSNKNCVNMPPINTGNPDCVGAN